MAYLPENANWEGGIHQFEITDPVQGGAEGIDNLQGRQLGNRTLYLKQKLEQEVADRASADQNLQSQIDVNREGVIANTAGIDAMKGRGGYLMAHDFGKNKPSQQELTNYALTQISNVDPLEIWNGTHVKNLHNSHVWALTNTPETNPPIFEWVDDGLDTVKIATEDTLGVIRSSPEEGYGYIEPATGKIKLILPAGLVAADSLSIISRHSPFAIATGERQITIRRGTYIPVEINGVDRWFKADEDIVIDVESVLGSALENGKDYNIFLVADGYGLEIKIDTADVPNGYLPGQVLAIAGFHTLCVGAGNIPNYLMGDQYTPHPASNYVAGDIIPISVWCLNHRPISSPKGMVYCDLGDFWFDLYLASGTGFNTKSVYQGAITRNRQYVDFVEDMACVKKELLNDSEFAMAMLGSNEKTAVQGASETGATSGGAGGRVDTTGRRMISAFFAEEGCGSIWQWLRDQGPAGGSSWSTQNGGKGDMYGTVYVLLAGGGWSHSADCGSRARYASNARTNSNASIGGRGRSRPMRVFG